MKSIDRSPVSAADVPAYWIEMIREIRTVREGQALRAGHESTIEVQSINTAEWQPLGLPAGGSTFTSEAERDIVLEQLRRTV